MHIVFTASYKQELQCQHTISNLKLCFTTGIVHQTQKRYKLKILLGKRPTSSMNISLSLELYMHMSST